MSETAWQEAFAVSVRRGNELPSLTKEGREMSDAPMRALKTRADVMMTCRFLLNSWSPGQK